MVTVEQWRHATTACLCTYKRSVTSKTQSQKSQQNKTKTASVQGQKTVDVNELYRKLHLFLNEESWYMSGRGWQREQKMNKPKTTPDSSVIEKLMWDTWRNSQWMVGVRLETWEAGVRHQTWHLGCSPQQELSCGSVLATTKRLHQCVYKPIIYLHLMVKFTRLRTVYLNWRNQNSTLSLKLTWQTSCLLGCPWTKHIQQLQTRGAAEKYILTDEA